MNGENEAIRNALIQQYVLGLTTAEENRRIEEMAESDPHLSARISKLRQALDDYASQHNIPPPKRGPRSPEELATIDREMVPEASERLPSGAWLGLGLFLTFILLAVGCGYFYWRTQRLQAELQATRAQAVQDAHHRDVMDQSSLPLAEEMMQVLNSEHTRVVELPHEDGPVIYGYYNHEQQFLLLNLAALPPAPADHHYALYGVQGNERHRLEILHSPREKQLQQVTYRAGLDSLELFLEPATGSTASSRMVAHTGL